MEYGQISLVTAVPFWPEQSAHECRAAGTPMMPRVFAFVFVIVCLILVACQTMAAVAEHPSADTRDWVVHRVQVDDEIVEFSIPDGGSADFSAFSVPDKVDLSGADSFDENNEGPSLLRRAWDYRENRYSEVDGTLRVYIGIGLSSRPLKGEGDIKGAILEGSDLYARNMARGRPGLLDPPVQISKMKLDGVSWTRVDYKLSGTYFVSPIDRYHYLKVSLRAGGFSRPDWRSDAQAAADAILRSVRIFPLH
jgi:hypothetical protein